MQLIILIFFALGQVVECLSIVFAKKSFRPRFNTPARATKDSEPETLSNILVQIFESIFNILGEDRVHAL